MSQAPANFSFAAAASPAQLVEGIRRDRPRVVVVSDHAVAREVAEAWRAACPTGELLLVRRGTSLDKIDARACRDLGIEIINTPAVNARHVADFVLEALIGEGDAPSDLRVLGAGDVGREIVKQARSLGVHTQVLARPGASRDAMARVASQGGVALTESWDAIADGASAMAICVALNEGTTKSVTASHIASMRSSARIVCVSKPDVFTDDALRELARGERSLVVDYGPATLDAFRERLQRLGIPAHGWVNPPQLTTVPMLRPACMHDLDFACAMRIATWQASRFAARESGRSFTIRGAQAEARQGLVARVIGRGVNGLFQAMNFLLAGYRVTVHGGSRAEDGASHKDVNMRHLSATETTARPVFENAAVHAIANDFVLAINIGSIELFTRLLQDNPELRRFAAAPLMRAIPQGRPGAEEILHAQRDVHMRLWPSAAQDIELLEGSRVRAETNVQGVSAGLVVPGYELEFRGFMSQLASMLAAEGVDFIEERIEPGTARQAEVDAVVISARGKEEVGVQPVTGWFLKLPSVGGEGDGVRGLKPMHDLPVGVMNVRREGSHILVSGGQVHPGASSQEKEETRLQFLRAVEQHFPRSFAAADGAFELIECDRPATRDGIALLDWDDAGQLVVGGTFAGGMTEAAFLAALARTKAGEALNRRAAASTPVAAVMPVPMQVAEVQ